MKIKGRQKDSQVPREVLCSSPGWSEKMMIAEAKAI
jgi:hypothetical protein